MILAFENQVTSFVLSKKLCELGVRQDSLYFHIEIYHSENDVEKDIVNRIELERYKIDIEFPRFSYFAAYTVAELLELLPRRIHPHEDATLKLFINLHKGVSFYGADYDNAFLPACPDRCVSIADSLGVVLEKSMKYGYIKAEDL